MFNTLSCCLFVGLFGLGAAVDSFRPPTHIVHPHVWCLLEEHGPAVKVWVFFKDKGVHSLTELEPSVANLAHDYNPRAIERRRLRRTAPDLFDDRDLPVCAEYVAEIVGTGASMGVTSKWVNAVSVYATENQIGAIAALPFVRSVEPVRRSVRMEAVPIESVRGVRSPIARGTDFYGLAQEQLEQINIPDLHAAGSTGSDVVIGILDTGFQRIHEVFNNPDHPLVVLAEYDFVADDPNAGPEEGDDPDQHVHGTLILGTLGAYLPDVLVGGAYDAAFILAKTEDVTQEVQAEEDQYVAGLEFIEANGGDMATSSLGYIDWYEQTDMDGLTAVTTIAVNTATENGLACVTAAGNQGQDSDLNSLLAPGDAFDVLTCGAVNSTGTIADFSSKGPTADGRVKPEVLARGVDTFTVAPDSVSDYATASGTSLSTPLVACAVASIIDAHPEWTIAQIRTALTETASDFLANGTYDPLFIRGYGIIDAFAASQMLLGGGDADQDGDVDLVDFAGFQACFSGAEVPRPNITECRVADFDGDGDVDLADYAAFLAVLTGPV